MRSQLLLPVAMASLLVACTEVVDESTAVTEIVTGNRISVNRISVNRISVNRISVNRISVNRISASRLELNLESTDQLLATEGGREVLAVIVNCALPEDVTLVGEVDGTVFEFPGAAGLARQWLSAPLDREAQGWVSACLFSRVNAHDVSVQISMRGAKRGLAVSEDERAAFPLEEGAFFGNVFVPVEEPIQWYACRGEAQASGEIGSLIDRDCTEPDLANPGLTQCGFFDAGDCGSFAANQACETFSEHGTFYRRCHAAPIQRHGSSDDQVFREVITTFVRL